MMRVLAAMILVTLGSAPALAQTASGGTGTGGNIFTSPPASVVAQARDQAEGNFPPLERGALGGHIQEAWNFSDDKNGVVEFAPCAGCLYKLRLRERMVTLVEMPENFVIVDVFTGDGEVFPVQPIDDRHFLIEPILFGYDTTIIVQGKRGDTTQTFTFYVRSENAQSAFVPDVLVRVRGPALAARAPRVEKTGSVLGPPALVPEHVPPMAPPPVSPRAEKDTPEGDAQSYLKEYPYDPAAVFGFNDYELSGDETLRPEIVYRDAHFTYVQFGDRWNEVELPVAFVVVDGIDETVNTRVNGTTLVIESVQPLITLKSGTRYLCIEFTGEALL